MTTNQELLEKAVVNLTLENAKLKMEIAIVTADKDLFWKWFIDKKEELEKIKDEILNCKAPNNEAE